MHPDRRARDELIRQLLPRVRLIANWHIRRVNSRSSIADDIYSAGLEGLVRGVDRYDPQHGEPKPYVDRRIEGEIVDFIRSQDHLTRHYRARAKATGVEPWSAPVSIDRPVRSLADDGGRVTRIADVLPDEVHERPEDAAVRHGQVAAIERAARALSPRTQDVLRRYYTDAAGMVEISQALGVTESRVCQIVHEAHARIREALGVAGPARRSVQRRAARRRRLAEDPTGLRPPRECSVCGGTGHRADNQRHRFALGSG